MASVRAIFAAILEPFDRLGPTLGLVSFSVLTGLGMLWVIGKVTPQGRLAVARDRMAAAVYELRIFLDSPRRILAAQLRLIGLCGLYVALLLPATLVVLPPLALWWGPLEARHGLEPLRAGDPALVRVRLASSGSGHTVAVAGATGARVTAPAVTTEDGATVYLRLALEGGGEHALALDVDGVRVTKRLSARPGQAVDAERRAGLWQLVAAGGEPPLPRGGPVAALDVLHAPSERRFAGLRLPWWGAWLAVATATALLMRRPLGVTL